MRTHSTEMSVADIEAQARELRATAIRSWGHGIAQAARAIWNKVILQPVAKWVEHERTIRELSMLDDRELSDLGVTRGLIPYIAAGKLTAVERTEQPVRITANENRPTHRAA